MIHWLSYLRPGSLCCSYSFPKSSVPSVPSVPFSTDSTIPMSVCDLTTDTTHGSDSQNEFEIALSELREIGTHLGPVVFCSFDNKKYPILRTCCVVEKNPIVRRILFILLFFMFCRRLVGYDY